MLKIAVLISGRGSNLQALIDAEKTGHFPAHIVSVISNDPSAQGLERAKAAQIPTHVINHKDFKDRQSFEEALDEKLTKEGVQLICLAGFMRLLTPWFVDRWLDRLINIHPSLLPAFPGLDTHKKAIEYGAQFTGCTVHFVRSAMDHGPIIMQAVIPVLPDDTEEALAARVLKAEHTIYPLAVSLIAESRVNVINEKVLITGATAPQVGLINPLLAKS
ncbi:MAG: phosphoribosylglycinamide formyltransferase [Alphaproteobacteria bacterium]